MASFLSIRKVVSQADLNAFITLPWWLYRDTPTWVPPLLSMQRQKFDRRKNPAWDYLEGDLYIACYNDQPVGTIAAFVNHRHNEYHGERIGFFGFFETIDDQEVASALLETAATAIQARGYDALRGPASFSTNDECGLLIKGFDDPPAILMPYNPPYYQRLIESVPGFNKVMDLYSYRLTLAEWEQSGKLAQMQRVTQRNNERRGITVRPMNPRRLGDDLVTFRAIYNQAWEKNWGFVPLSDRELDALVHDLGSYLEPRLAILAFVNGDPAGFLLGFPDLNQPIQRAYPRPGKPELITLAQVLWHWKIRPKVTRIRVALMGVTEQHRVMGVEAAMLVALLEQARQIHAERGWYFADAGWVLETNTPMIRLVSGLGADDYKHYRFYERALR